MSSINKKLSIKEAISLTDYNNNIKKSLVSFLINNYTGQKNKLYLFTRGKNLPKLFLLKLNIPVKYNKKEYDINILIYFPINFPLIQPEIFFNKNCSTKINPNCLNYIDEETLKINYNTFFKWENNFQSFKNLIKELNKQFNNNFPIFTLNDEFDITKYNNYDCVLREHMCKEIEFNKPNNVNNVNKNIIINKKIIKTEGNSDVKILKVNTLNISPKKMNLNLKNEISPNKNKKVNSNIKINLDDISNYKRGNTIKNTINTENINNKINNELYIKSESENFDEKTSKDCLIKLLLFELYPKIYKINTSIQNSNNNLSKIKSNIITELKYYNSKEKQTQTFEKSVNLFKKEIKQYNSNINSNIKNKLNFSNLDNVFKIKNKTYYSLQSKEKVLEEYILVIKKNLEKKNLELKSALKLVRNLSRQIFNIKYKCLCLTGENI